MILTLASRSTGSSKLEALGLDWPSLQDVLLYANAERATYTEYDAPGGSGMAGWSRQNRRLAEIYVPQGWQRITPSGQPTIVHPSGKYGVIAAAGDHRTGQPWGRPSTKNPRGTTFHDAVDDNVLVLFDMPNDDADILRDVRETWVLLSFSSGDGVIYSELSLPSSMSANYIDDWHTRVLLPAIEPGAEPRERDQDEPPNYDFAVTRK